MRRLDFFAFAFASLKISPASFVGLDLRRPSDSPVWDSRSVHSVEFQDEIAGSLIQFGAQGRNLSGLVAKHAGNPTASQVKDVVGLNGELGYETAAKIAKEAAASGRTVKEVALSMTDLTAARLDELLDPAALCGDAGRERET